MKEFYVGQRCGMRTKSGEVMKGIVHSDKIVKRKKIEYLQVQVKDDILLFPLVKTMFVLE
jgi:transcriptional antiterminator Rof (Rho-off)